MNSVSFNSNLIAQVRQSSRDIVREIGLLSTPSVSFGISSTQGNALLELSQFGSLLVTELAEKLNLDKSTSSRLVTQLSKKGLIKIMASSDQRQKRMTLGKRGEEKVRLLHEDIHAQISDGFGNLRDDERVMTLNGLALFAKALKLSRIRRAFEIRPVRAEDDIELREVLRRLRVDYSSYAAELKSQTLEMDSIFEAYHHPLAAFFVVVNEGRIVGGAGIGPLHGAAPSICELRKMYLLPEARGLGLGKKLMQKCIDAAKNRGYSSCFLETMKRMHEARDLYLGAGFKPLSRPQMCIEHDDGGDAWFSLDLADAHDDQHRPHKSRRLHPLRSDFRPDTCH